MAAPQFQLVRRRQQCQARRQHLRRQVMCRSSQRQLMLLYRLPPRSSSRQHQQSQLWTCYLLRHPASLSPLPPQLISPKSNSVLLVALIWISTGTGSTAQGSVTIGRLRCVKHQALLLTKHGQQVLLLLLPLVLLVHKYNRHNCVPYACHALFVIAKSLILYFFKKACFMLVWLSP
jgi:hypothetical protein